MNKTIGKASMISEQEVIAACQSGKKDMYRHLVEKYKERAYYTALLYTKNRDDALDLSQEAFYRAYKALNTFDNSRNFYTWFYQILKNLCINFVTRKKKHSALAEEHETGAVVTSSDRNPEEIFELNERNALLWQALNRLNEKDREILILKEFNNLSYKEIAEALEIPLGSVMSRLYYARKRVLKEWEKLNG